MSFEGWIQLFALSVTLGLCYRHEVSVSAAEGACSTGDWFSYRTDADVKFTLLISNNLSDFSKGAMSDCIMTHDMLQHYMVVEWLVETMNKANNNSGYIPGISIGFEFFKDCSMPDFAARNSLLSTKTHPSQTSQCTNKSTMMTSSNAGLLMVTNSMVAKNVATTMKDSPVPVISATATLPELSDRHLYPNFFRTVPSDNHQMSMIADMLKALSWTYIVVVYQDNLYGHSGMKALQQKAHDRSICIHKAIMLPGSSFEINKNFYDIMKTIRDQMIAVVVIADVEQTQHLLCYLESPSPRKFHFIMTSAVNRHKFPRCNHASWTFAVSTDNDIDLSGFKSYMNHYIQNELNKGPNEEKHPVIGEVLKSSSAARVSELTDASLAPYITSTINAVLALVNSIRVLHHETCDNKTGICESMTSELNKNKLQEVLASNSVSYSKINQGLSLDALLTQDVTFTFNADSGDILPQRNLDEYTIYFLNEQQYKRAGSFANGEIQFDISQLEALSPDPLPTSRSRGRVDGCLQKGRIPMVYLEGDVYIVGVFSIHSANGFQCGEWRDIGNDTLVVEGFIYAVQLLRQKTGINFGAIGIDDCYSPTRVEAVLMSYLSDTNPANSVLFSFHVPREKIVGVIGCRSSDSTLRMASIVMPLKIPVISYAASSPDLNDKDNYPFFLRTVPSDVYQAQVLVDIIKKIGWNYVGLLYVKNNYGTKGMMAFRNIVDQHGSEVCVPKEFGISKNNNAHDNDVFFEAFQYFTKLEIKVIVFFGDGKRFQNFIANLELNGRHGNFIFLATESVGINTKILEAGGKSAAGSITLMLQQVCVQPDTLFRRHLETRKPLQNDTNIWFGEWWQRHFECNFKGGLINIFEGECKSDQTLDSDIIDVLVGEQRLIHTMNAVLAMGNAFKYIKDNQCKGEFPCQFLKQNPNISIEAILKQSINSGQLCQYDLFDAHGNGALGFDVFNVQKTDSAYAYVKVGTFSGLGAKELDVSQLKFYDTSEKIVSINANCTEDLCFECKHSKTKQSIDPAVITKIDQQSKSKLCDFEIVVIVFIIFTLVIVVVIVAIFIICYQRKWKGMLTKLNPSEDLRTQSNYNYIHPHYYHTRGRMYTADSGYQNDSSQVTGLEREDVASNTGAMYPPFIDHSNVTSRGQPASDGSHCSSVEHAASTIIIHHSTTHPSVLEKSSNSNSSSASQTHTLRESDSGTDLYAKSTIQMQKNHKTGQDQSIFSHSRWVPSDGDSILPELPPRSNNTRSLPRPHHGKYRLRGHTATSTATTTRIDENPTNATTTTTTINENPTNAATTTTTINENHTNAATITTRIDENPTNATTTTTTNENPTNNATTATTKTINENPANTATAATTK